MWKITVLRVCHRGGRLHHWPADSWTQGRTPRTSKDDSALAWGTLSFLAFSMLPGRGTKKVEMNHFM
jgi:hypothetical protein